MIIYLMRHGHARPRGHAGDEDRSLTLEGRQSARKMLEVSSKVLGLRADLILSSPYRRALETAQIAKEILKPRKRQIVVRAVLEPDRTPYEVCDFLGKQKLHPNERMLLVSHQPSVGELLSYLLGAEFSLASAPASIAAIECAEVLSPRSGRLLWFVCSDVIVSS